MRKRPDLEFHPLSPMTLSRISEQSVRVESLREVMQVAVLAPDLFRLRIVRGRKLSQRPSWAVINTDWEPVPVQIRSARQSVSLQTACGKLSLQLGDGSWKLLDPSGSEIFSAIPHGTGFTGAQSQ